MCPDVSHETVTSKLALHHLTFHKKRRRINWGALNMWLSNALTILQSDWSASILVLEQVSR